jgi:serine/threonine protein kinase
MDERCIEVSEVVRVGENCGAQVVVTADGFIAKIYDPLYYEFRDRGYLSREPVSDADEDYIRESEVYSHLHDTSLSGGVVPMYYGSWTLSIPTLHNGHEWLRDVRMILLERVPGVSMHDVDPDTLTYHERENIMIKLIEAEADIHFSGVKHNDLEPRNVILSPSNSCTPYEDGNFRLCIIDYACCWVPKDGKYKPPHTRLHNPLFHWVGQTWWSDWHWLPSEDKANDWMWKVWGNGGKNKKYVVAEREPGSSVAIRPKLRDVREKVKEID